MSEAQQGNRDSYHQLLRELTVVTRAFLSSRLSDSDSVEDAVQESLIRLDRARATFIPGRSFSAWYFTIARNIATDSLRRYARRSRLEDHEPVRLELLAAREPEEPDPDIRLSLLKEFLPRLSNRQQEIIRMMKWEGKSIRETAILTGMSESSVKVTAHRAYKKLRQLIENSGISADHRKFSGSSGYRRSGR